MRKKIVVTIIVLGVLVAVILVLRTIRERKYPAVQRASDAAKSRGNPQAKFKIVEFTDYQCPACARAAKELGDYLAGPRGQDVFVEYRPYPLTPKHQFAFRAAIYAECAARQGKFWPVHELFFARQKEWTDGLDAEEKFKGMAKEAGLSMEILTSCVNDPSVDKVVLDMKENGMARGVMATPTYFVNGQMVVGIKKLLERLNSGINESR